MITFFLLIILGISNISENISCANSQLKIFTSFSNEKITFIDNVSGQATSPYTYGLQVGRRYFSQYRLLSHFCIFQCIKGIETKISQEIKNYKKIIETYYPEYLEELKGLSHATNINIDKLLSVQLILFSDQHPECTITLSTGNATKKNQTFLTQNWDAKISDPMVFIERLFFTRHVHTHNAKLSGDRYNYVFLGIPILLEIFLMNEEGLCFGGNGLSLATNRSIDTGSGMPTYLLERKTMATCSNISEVAQLWKNTKRSSYDTNIWPYFWDFAITAWCDKNGGILMIEQTHSYIITVFGNSTDITGGPANIIWHANHHQWLDPVKTGSKFPWEYPSSARRTQRARELLLNNYGNITLDTCIKIITDHGGGTNPNGPDSSDICRHPDSNDSHITVFAWIAEPKECTVYLTQDQPCQSNLIKYNCSKQLDDNPPYTPVEIHGKLGTNGWYISNVIVTITSKDDLSGIKKSYYKINKERWKSYKNSIILTLDSKYKLEYKSVDTAGNSEPIKKIGFKIDQTPPTIRLIKYLIGGDIIKFSAIVRDTFSGINRVEFYIEDKLQSVIFSEPYIWYCVFDENQFVTAVVYDNAGNSASDSKTTSAIIF